nr:DEAD/DEAH box helicase [Spirochaetota bacterium]
KETSRRQQVGRGLRLAVNQDGRRITYGYLNEDKNLFYEINTLDVIVSGHENLFISEIQKEIIDNSFIISTGFLRRSAFYEKGFTGNELNRLFIAFVDNNVVIEDVEEDKYIIKSPVKEFVLSNKEKLNFLSEDKYKILVSLFDFNHDDYIEDANKQKEKVKIRPEKIMEFAELWETINKKSSIVYKDLNEEELINSISLNFNRINIPEVNIKYVSQEYDAETNEIKNIHSQVLGKVDFFKNNEYAEFIFDLVKKERFPLAFILKIFNKIKIDKIKNNPKEAKSILTEIIKEEIHKNIIQKIDYKFENEIKITSLHENDKYTSTDARYKYKSEVVYTEIGKFLGDIAPDNFLFEKIVYDSDIERKSISYEYLNVNKNKVVVYAKLPKISLPTPYKTYNPDFAYLLETEQKKKLFLIVETKGYDSENLIPQEELRKIEYAEIFFKKLQKEIGDAAQILFKKRINKQELGDLLKEFE